MWNVCQAGYAFWTILGPLAKPPGSRIPLAYYDKQYPSSMEAVLCHRVGLLPLCASYLLMVIVRITTLVPDISSSVLILVSFRGGEDVSGANDVGL